MAAPHELDLSVDEIYQMIQSSLGRQVRLEISLDSIVKSDSYGPHLHRSWVFTGDAAGSIERYWGGLKMICSVMGGTPRTSFFTEEGVRTTNKGLKGLDKE